jgi:glycosyltransferase involved in cell wall biosynthesis
MNNILHAICSFETGGAEKLLLDILRYNNENPIKEYRLHVVIINDVIDDGMLLKLEKYCDSVYLLRREEGSKCINHFFKLHNIIKSNNINIIHCHDYGSKSFAIFLKTFTFTKIKIVYTVHSTFEFHKLRYFSKLFHKLYVSKNIAISNSVKSYCIDNNINNVEVIYNGIFIDDYKVKRKEVSNSKCLNIINVSRITHKIKGQDILIKALGICKNEGINFQCKLVGGKYRYDISSWEYLHKLVDKNNLNNNVQFLGSCNNVSKLLEQSDLFIFTSRKEGLGIVLLEAMAAQLPIISSNIEGPAEIINHGENGLLYEVEDERSLADLISYAFYNREKLQKLADNGYSSIDSYSISNMVNRYIRVYSDIL